MPPTDCGIGFSESTCQDDQFEAGHLADSIRGWQSKMVYKLVPIISQWQEEYMLLVAVGNSNWHSVKDEIKIFTK